MILEMKLRIPKSNNIKFRWILIAVPLFFFIISIGCGAPKQVNTDVHVPELDRSQYNDSNYIEGWEKLKNGFPKEALKNFQDSNVVDEKLYVGFGYSFLGQSKIELARRNFEKALSINPNNLQALFGMASLYELINEKKKAFQLYAKIRTEKPENAWAKVRYDSIKTAETENYLKKAEQYKHFNQTEEYINALENASWYSPEIIDIKIEIADFYNTEQQYEQAARQYEQILEKAPYNTDILMKLAAVYEKLNRFDSALVVYRKMQELKPGDLDISNKINELKIKFYDSNLPPKFKDIYFKSEVNREELAALIGYYFDKYLEKRSPVIITDIAGSFAQEYIIRVCSLDIMNLMPDHSFDRYGKINRAALAVVFNSLLKYLETSSHNSYEMQFHPLDEVVEPSDISPLHKDYETIKFLVNAEIMKLDENNRFNPTRPASPSEVLESLKKILNSIQDN